MADLNQVQQTIQSSSVPGVQRLNARAAGDSIEIHGQAESISARNAAMKMITAKHGDVGFVNRIEIVSRQPEMQKVPAAAPGISQSPQGPQGQQQPAAAQGQQRVHVVKKGETLSHIAQQYYGKASAYNKIFEANRDQLNDPDKIREGMKLQIP